MAAPFDPTLQLDCSPMIPVVIGATQYIRDFSGYGRNGAVTNYAGTDVEFEDGDGQGQIVLQVSPKYLNHGQVLNYTFEDFSFEIAVNPSSIANSPVIVYKGQFNINGYYIQLFNLGNIRFVTSQAAANQITNSSLGIITTGIWHHIVISRCGATVRMYKNGVETGYSAVGVHTNPATSAENLQVGKYAAGVADDYSGRINRIRSWSRCLGAAEVKERYQLWNRGV